MSSLEQAVVNIRTAGGTLRTLQLESTECCVAKLKQNISTESGNKHKNVFQNDLKQK